MKKLLLVLLVAILTYSSKGQTIINLSYSPDVQEFVNQAGPFLKKEVYPINENKLSLNVIVMTDFSSQKKIGYVEYTSQDATGNVMKIMFTDMATSYYTSSLDAAELSDCITCLEYARENLLDTKPEGDPTYFFYDTRLGGRIGVKGTPSNNTSRWVAFFNADPLERTEFERTFPLGGKAIDKIIDAFKNAQRLIAEKVGMEIPKYVEPNDKLVLIED